MGVSLTEFEVAAPFSGDYAAAVAAVQERLSQIQLAQVAHGKRAILLLEGWDGSGRHAALRRLAGALDPCHLSVHPMDGRALDEGRHWLASFWARLPRAGETAVFFPGWYRRSIEAQACGELGKKEWARAFDEINEFEAQQTDHGTILVKLFFHLSPEAQALRLQQRMQDPWLRGAAVQDRGQLSDRASWTSTWQEMFARSDTRWARWTVIDGGNEQSACIAALAAVADALAKQVPAEPPALDDDKIVMLGRG